MNKKFGLATVLVWSISAFAQPYYLPNAELTPGRVDTTDRALICQATYSKDNRRVSGGTKDRVYDRYGVKKSNCRMDCKIDHLIPIAIGGSNDIRNLWPHEYGAEWSVYEKTRLEVRLRKAVCKQNMDVADAQNCIRNDWTKCYVKFYPGDHENGVVKRKMK